MSDNPCLYCRRVVRAERVARGEAVESGEIIAQNEHAVAFRDPAPISRGHAVVVTRRHEPNLLAMAQDERRAVWDLVNTVALDLRSTHLCDGLNIGLDIGPAAGQGVAHAYVHIVPRYVGDATEPIGGVRSIVPQQKRVKP